MGIEKIFQLQKPMMHTPFEPIASFAPMYGPAFIPLSGIAPYEYTGWRDETCSWKTTCYLHTGLNPTDTLKLSGPDVFKFLSTVCCTNFDNFEVGRIKHGLMVNEQGLVTMDGVIFRTGEDEVTTYWMVPTLPYALDSGKYGKFDVKKEYLTGQVFLFQIGGPKSFEVMEAVCRDSIRDLKYLRHRENEIAGKPVRIARLGMAGTLAYEVHGNIEDAVEVYNAIWEAGQKVGMRRLGSHCYPMNHAENGFPQFGVHFLEPRDEDLMKYIMDPATEGMEFTRMSFGSGETPAFRGSAGDNVMNYFHNPYEFGWGKMIKFDHEFVGCEALKKIKEENKRNIVTLEWNLEDIQDVWASQFRDEEPYKYIDEPLDYAFYLGPHRDKVIDQDGNTIGLSFGRQNSAYFHRMISICCLDTAYTELGTEVTVVWGDVGKRQKNIRATVVRYPYNNVMRSNVTDVKNL